MMYPVDERLKKLFLQINLVLALITNGFAVNVDYRLNEINNSTTLSPNEDTRKEDALANDKIGLFVFTQYCGPGERIWKTISGKTKLSNRTTYADIDGCCKTHDDCPNFILNDADADKYSGLPRRSQLFARLQCSCDAQFFSCLNDLRSQYASTVAFGYGLVQSYCFDFNYPIVACNKYSSNFPPTRRCIEYTVDDTKAKIWQWFDVPLSSLKIYDFPRTTS